MEAQRSRARAAARAPRAADEASYRAILEAEGPTVFVGRRSEEYTTSARILAVLDGGDGLSEVVLDRTPFYAESGGQVGDSGKIESSTGSAEVVDTIAALPGLHVHRARLSGDLLAGQDAIASIDAARRESIRRNHTATHLLHAALRKVLGEHVRQQGSLVAPDRLRFDFSHHGAPSPEELIEVATIVNEQLLLDAEVDTLETSRVEAEAMGAVAFFGDKYGEVVRVVRAGETSLEFCGGTHVDGLGSIGSFQIISEGSIGSNTRRIEAVTGMDSFRRSLEQTDAVLTASSLLKSEPEQLQTAIERLMERVKVAERERDALRSAGLEAQAATLAAEVDGGILVSSLPGIGADDLRQLASNVQRRSEAVAVVLGSVADDKVAVAVATDGTCDAKELVAQLGPIIGGGGGGSPALALAGGRQTGALPDALRAADGVLRA